jgi:putative ABC transport system permease protein
MASMLQELRLAFRLLRSRPWFALSAVLPMALAIATGMAALTLVDAVLFRPMGLRDPASLVTVYGFSRSKARYLSNSMPDYEDLRSLSGVVASATSYVRIPLTCDLARSPERVATELATGDYFRTLGVPPSRGRTFGPDDDRPGAQPVTLISDALWESRFQRSAAALGSSILVANVPVTIVGVMPRGFEGTLLDWGAPPALWMPMALLPRVSPPFAALDFRNRRDMRWLMMTARLKPGATIPALQAALDVLQARLATADPKLYADAHFVALAAQKARFFPAYREAAVRYMSLLAAVSAAVLLIACFNLMNLLLGLAAMRERELATRLALGAGRGRIVLQAVTEAFALTLSANAISLPIGLWLTGWLGAFGRISIVSLNLNLTPDPRALAWSAGAALAIGMVIGGLTALRSGRIDLVNGLRGAGARPAFPRLAGIGLRDLFVGSQVACAMVVLVAAVTLAGSLLGWQRSQLGFDPGGTLLATLDTAGAARSPRDLHQFCRELLEQLREGRFEGAALISEPLPGNIRWTRELAAPGSAATQEVEGNAVSDGYFQLTRMPIEAGRAFLPSDDDAAQPVVILNRSAADLLFPRQNPVGRSLRIAGESSDRQVIGISAGAQYHPLSDVPTPYFFVPMAQVVRPQFTICVRTAGPPAAFAPALRQTVARLAPGTPLFDIRTGEEQVASGSKQIRVAALTCGVLAFVGTLLALAGLFAITAWRVAEQRRDIAIRVAVGAQSRRVLAGFAVRAFATGALGAAAGAGISAWTVTLLRSSVAGVTQPGLELYLAAGVLLLALVSVACVLPARQALRIDPAALLRVQ